MTGEGRSTAVLRHRIEMHVQAAWLSDRKSHAAESEGGDGI
ncbi:hypothetical protein EPIB2_666 [Tritonibacter mobilis]|nr:hypothetical protein EPIB2_666 [Tritonibacter mobilis]